MSYIIKKLSEEDRDILNNIYDKLEKITVPKRYQRTAAQGHSLRTGACNQKNARQVCFGIVKYQGKYTISKYSKIYPEMMDLFKEFIDSHFPDFEFTSVYVNKNVECKKHIDSKNVGESLLVGLGDYTNGETSLYLDKEHIFDIQNNSLIFNGSEIEHRSLPFKGTRYSLVFFKT